MDELYTVGQRVAQEHAGAPSALGPGALAGAGAAAGAVPAGGTASGIDPAAFAQALQSDPQLAELLAGGGDIEQYLQSYEQMLAQGVTPGNQLNVVDAEGGIHVRPDPGFVVKTRDTASGMKVFINVVSNEHVEKPHMKSMPELEGEEGCRVPLSVGTPVEDFDKKNEPCMTYDLVANPDVVDECNQHAAFRDQVIELCMAAIAQKYKIALDTRYKLPKMKYKGATVQIQRLRKANQNKIQEVSSDNAPMPGQSKKEREAAAAAQRQLPDGGGPPQPQFCIFYSRPDAQPIDGFEAAWPSPPDGPEDAAGLDHLFGLDLPCYRVNAFQEKIRGTMKNKSEREQEDSEKPQDGNEEPPGAKETKQMLAGRTCVVQVRMPNLDRHIPSLKQFGIEVSDECLRVSFPMLPRQGRAAYSALCVWWPRHFCSAQATASWEPKSDTLTVVLPTDSPDDQAAFDEDLLNAVF